MKPYLSIILRDLRLGFARGGDALSAAAFFLIVTSLFPLALSGNAEWVARVAPAAISVSALLAALLSLETVYHRDFDDGTFDLLFMTPLSRAGIIAAKMTSHWLMSGLVLLLAAIVVARMQFVPVNVMSALFASLAAGTVYLSLLGGAGAVLTLGSKRPGMLLSVIVLPLFVPALVLGVLAVDAAAGGVAWRGYVLLQTALVFVAAPLLPWLAATALKGQLSS
jgi:heme exporter protein B